jgi:hypothetical protein
LSENQGLGLTLRSLQLVPSLRARFPSYREERVSPLLLGRKFCRIEDTSPKSILTKEKNRSAKHRRMLSLAEIDLAIAIPEARGLNPCP